MADRPVKVHDTNVPMPANVPWIPVTLRSKATGARFHIRLFGLNVEVDAKTSRTTIKDVRARTLIQGEWKDVDLTPFPDSTMEKLFQKMEQAFVAGNVQYFKGEENDK